MAELITEVTEDAQGLLQGGGRAGIIRRSPPYDPGMVRASA